MVSTTATRVSVSLAYMHACSLKLDTLLATYCLGFDALASAVVNLGHQQDC